MTRNWLRKAYVWAVLPFMSILFGVRVWQDYSSGSACHYIIAVYWLLIACSLIWLTASRSRRAG